MTWNKPLPIPAPNDVWGAQLNAAISEVRGRFDMAGKFTPPIGDYLLPTGLASFQSNALTSGRAHFLPFDVFCEATFSHIGFRIGTNAAGGSTAFTAAIYADNGEGNGPDLTKQLAHTPTPDNLTSGTNRDIALNAATTLEHGRYWVGCLYYAASSPATTPALHGANIMSLGWTTSGLLWFAGGSPPRGLYVNGLTELPTSQVSLSAGYSEIPPITALKRSA